MGLFRTFSNLLHSQDNLISERLDSIGYFDLIDNPEKKRFLKEKIDFNFNDDSNKYIGKGWLTFPNDSYISSVYNLEEYNNDSSTSDFRAFEVWAGSLFRGEFIDYLKSAKVVFERNNIKLDWCNEAFDENSKERMHHRITVNEIEYVIFSGPVSRDSIGDIMKNYLDSFRHILNEAILQQQLNYKVILVTQPEYVVFVLLSNEKLEYFKNIIVDTKNIIEE